MEKVSGIGGLFFRAKDPKTLAKWYQDNLGVTLAPETYEATDQGWLQEAGPTVFQPFPQDSDYFGNPEKMWMVNFRVRDLDAMVKQLKTASVEVKWMQNNIQTDDSPTSMIRKATQSSFGNRWEKLRNIDVL